MITDIAKRGEAYFKTEAPPEVRAAYEQLEASLETIRIATTMSVVATAAVIEKHRAAIDSALKVLDADRAKRKLANG